MLYNINFDIAGVILTLGLLLVYWTRRSYPTIESKTFLALALANAVGCVLDMLSSAAMSYADLVPLWLNYLLIVAYHISNATVALFFLLYILTVADELPKRGGVRKVAWALYALAVLLTVTTPATHLLFSFAPDGSYVHGPFFNVLYATSFSIVLIALVCLVCCRRTLNVYQIVPPIVACMAVFIGSAIEAIHPELLLQGFTISLVLVLVYESTSANSKFMFAGSYCYNFRAFRDHMNKRIKRGDRFSVIGIGLRDASYLSGVLDFNAYQALYINMSNLLRRELGQRNTFYLRNGCFAIVCDMGKESDVVFSAVDAIKRMELPVSCTVNLDPCFAVLRHPGIVNTGREADGVMVSALDSCVRDTSSLVNYVDGSALTVKRREAEVSLALRKAIKAHRFEVYYQPIRSVQTGVFDSAEALVRLNDPALGFISPDEFIPLAESNGTILEISEQILEQVCRFWRDAELAKLGVTRMDINLSAVQCAKRNMADQLLYALNRYGVDPSCVCMEVTETAVLNDRQTTKENLDKLHDAGIQLALDDYGTGYSSATNLFELPFDIVKVDKSVVWGAMEDVNALAVLKNVCEMCHSLDKQIVAEGVESEGMTQLLETLGAEHLQGYLYSKPLPEDAYLEFLREQGEHAEQLDHWCQSRFRKLDADLTLETLGAGKAAS